MEQKILFPQKVLANYRAVGDEFADQTVKAVFEMGYNPLANEDYINYQYNEQPIPDAFPTVLKKYFESLSDTEIDESLSAQGAAFFLEYAQPIMLCLGLYSLPYCYAAANGAKVLASSKRILNNPANRLNETADFVLDMHAPNAFIAGGKAKISIAKVRLMHAAIRYHILQKNDWNMKWGHPINQMDMAGTNYSFSLIVLRGLKKLGFDIPAAKGQLYLQFWNQIGGLLGLKHDLMPETNQEAFVLEQKIRQNQFQYSTEGEQLTKALLDYIDAQEAPFPVKGSAIAAYLLGEELSQLLKIPSKNISNKLGLPLKLLNKIQNQLKAKNYSYATLLADIKNQQPNRGASSNFPFIMNLTD